MAPLAVLGLGGAGAFKLAGSVFPIGYADNREVTTLKGVAKTKDALRSRIAAIPRSGPIVVVAAEGGGIHASYRAGRILAKLDDESGGRFFSHIAAISSVSGGSVGTALYVAAREGYDGSCIGGKMDDVLAQDLLSPILLRLFFTDWMSVAGPIAAGADRSRGLEAGMAVALDHDAPRKEVAVSLLNRGVMELACDPTRPLLFFNTASTQEGDRFVISADDLSGYLDKRPAFRGSANSMPNGDVSLAVAASLSARFPVVQPSGRIPLDKELTGRRYERVIDGGVFDNSGVSTALDIVQAVRDIAPERKVVLLIIGNHGTGEKELVERPTDVAFGETLALPATVLKMIYAKNGPTNFELAHRAPGQSVRIVNMEWDHDPIGVPLGWMLHRVRQEALAFQIGATDEFPKNVKPLKDGGRTACFHALNAAMIQELVEMIPGGPTACTPLEKGP